MISQRCCLSNSPRACLSFDFFFPSSPHLTSPHLHPCFPFFQPCARAPSSISSPPFRLPVPPPHHNCLFDAMSIRSSIIALSRNLQQHFRIRPRTLSHAGRMCPDLVTFHSPSIEPVPYIHTVPTVLLRTLAHPNLVHTYLCAHGRSLVLLFFTTYYSVLPPHFVSLVPSLPIRGVVPKAWAEPNPLVGFVSHPKLLLLNADSNKQ